MNASTLRKLATAVVLSAGLTSASGAFALDDLKLIAPAKPANAAELFSQPDVDGGLIGGASLVADDFLAIANAAVPR